MMAELINLFSIRKDVHIESQVEGPPSAKKKKKGKVAQTDSAPQSLLYKQLKNNYLNTTKKESES